MNQSKANPGADFFLAQSAGACVASGSAFTAVVSKVTTLSVGIFFDGTGNNKNDTDKSKPSNVARLWDAYREDGDPASEFRKVYVRGVGTGRVSPEDMELDNDWVLGAGFGQGGLLRIEYALDKLRAHLEGFRSEHRKRPEKVVLDVFGFSRGAALARHFVNVIGRNTSHRMKTAGSSPVRIETFDPKPEIRFLGLFDTVASFLVPGCDVDAGYCFHVDNSKARFIYHLVSEDEIRQNFDLQTVHSNSGSPAETIPESQGPWMVEEAVPGVHSDVGGGYADSREHENGNNHLARIYLRKMHAAALKHGVPFRDQQKAGALFALPPDIEKTLPKAYQDLQGIYAAKPGLRRKHAVMRAHQRHLDIIRAKILADEKAILFWRWALTNPSSSPDFEPQPIQRTIENIEADKAEQEGIAGWIENHRIRPIQSLIAQAHFQGDAAKFEAFESGLYAPFRKRCIHVSHAPFNSSTGMDPQFQRVDTSAWPYSALNEGQKSAFLLHGSLLLQREIFRSQPNQKPDILIVSSTLDVYLRILISDADGGNARPIGRGYTVEVVVSIRSFPDYVIGSQSTDLDGLANVFCFNNALKIEFEDTTPLSYYFRVKGPAVSLETGSGSGIEFGGEWSSEEETSLKDDRFRFVGGEGFYAGVVKGYSGRIIGTKSHPLEIYIRAKSSG
jgi:hypothetical protein